MQSFEQMVSDLSAPSRDLVRIVEHLAVLALQPQAVFRRMGRENRTAVTSIADEVSRIPQKELEAKRWPCQADFAMAAIARIVCTRGQAVTRRLDEESRLGGNPKRCDRSFGRMVRSKRQD